MVEGATLLSAALDAGAVVESVFVDAAAPAGVSGLGERALAAGARVFTLAPGVLARVADTVTPQPVLAVVHLPARPDPDFTGAGFVVVCVDLRDPGNAGTVVRSADAAGADAVVFCDGSVDPFNPKTVRASAGSVLHLPVLYDLDASDALARLRAADIRAVGAVPRGGTPYAAVDWCRPSALVLGNEAAGLGPGVADGLDELVTIPMAGRAESINVSMAASVLCFEAARQRSNVVAMPDDRPGTP